MSRRLGGAVALGVLTAAGAAVATFEFERNNSAMHTNVLKGFYNDQSWSDASGWDASIDFAYFPLRDVVVGRDIHDWSTTLDPALAKVRAKRMTQPLPPPPTPRDKNRSQVANRRASCRKPKPAPFPMRRIAGGRERAPSDRALLP